MICNGREIKSERNEEREEYMFSEKDIEKEEWRERRKEKE